jgi:hypothetical protein
MSYVSSDFPHNLIAMAASHSAYKIINEETFINEETCVVESFEVEKLVVVFTLAPLFSGVMVSLLQPSSELSPEKVAKNYLHYDHYIKISDIIIRMLEKLGGLVELDDLNDNQFIVFMEILRININNNNINIKFSPLNPKAHLFDSLSFNLKIFKPGDKMLQKIYTMDPNPASYFGTITGFTGKEFPKTINLVDKDFVNYTGQTLPMSHTRALEHKSVEITTQQVVTYFGAVCDRIGFVDGGCCEYNQEFPDDREDRHATKCVTADYIEELEKTKTYLEQAIRELG